MVSVSPNALDKNTAWRIRDLLSSHPTLGGGTANIYVLADHSNVVLEGWAMDQSLQELAIKLASRAAGRRAVTAQLTVRNCRDICSVPRYC